MLLIGPLSLNHQTFSAHSLQTKYVRFLYAKFSCSSIALISTCSLHGGKNLDNLLALLQKILLLNLTHSECWVCEFEYMPWQDYCLLEPAVVVNVMKCIYYDPAFHSYLEL